MSRFLLTLALLLLGIANAADPAAGIAAARQSADAALAEQRTAIAAERAELMAAVQASHRAAETQRERLRAAVRERDLRVAEAKKRRQEAERELALVRSLVDRAVVAARVSDERSRALAKAAPAERVAAAIAAMRARIVELPARLGARLSEEPIIAHGGAVVTAPVLHLGGARSVALGATPATRGLLARAGDGQSLLVVGSALPAHLATSGAMPAMIAIDPDGTAAQQVAAHARSLADWIKAGRFFIWPIMILFVVGVLIAASRAIALVHLRVDPRRLLAVADLLHRGQQAEAERLVANRATPLDRVLAVGIVARHRPRQEREALIEQALIAETPRLQQGLAIILVLAGVAPLLGLLGTVTGMIDMFGVIAQQGSGNAKSLSGAISEALIVTQAGMMAAIPLLLVHAVLARIIERRLLVLDEAACGLLGLAEHGDAPVRVELVGAAR